MITLAASAASATGTAHLVKLLCAHVASAWRQPILLGWTLGITQFLGLGPGLVATAVGSVHPGTLPFIGSQIGEGAAFQVSTSFFVVSGTLATIASAAATQAARRRRTLRHERRLRQERHRAVGLLQRAVHARETVLASAAHELKGPVTALLLQAQNWQRRLGREAVAENAVRQGWKRQSEHLERLTALIERLFDTHRLAGGSLRLSRQRLDLCRLVESVRDRLTAEAQRAHCEVSLHLPTSEVVTGDWDRLRLEQVLENLLSNAFKYGSGRPVGVYVIKQEAEVTVRVTDQGNGIGQADQEKIFRCFERAVAPDFQAPGLGLGLWIVQQIVAAHGGTIRVRSAVGEGAEFTVALPCR